MPQITVRLTAEEHRQLLLAAALRNLNKSDYLRRLIRKQPLETVSDWLEWADQHQGKKLLRS